MVAMVAESPFSEILNYLSGFSYEGIMATTATISKASNINRLNMVAMVAAIKCKYYE